MTVLYRRYTAAIPPEPTGCDYGVCDQIATRLVIYPRELRPMCARHAARVAQWDPRIRVTLLSQKGDMGA